MQKYCLRGAEDRGVHSDSQRERQNHHACESRIFAQHSQTESNVLRRKFPAIAPAPRDSRHCSDNFARRQIPLRARRNASSLEIPAAHEFFRARFDVKLQFGIHRAIELVLAGIPASERKNKRMRLNISNTPLSSFVSQRDDRIHQRRSPRWHVTRQKRRQQKHDRHNDQHQRIGNASLHTSSQPALG